MVHPPNQDAEFVPAIGAAPTVYQRPYDPKRPLIRMDENSKQLVAETRRRPVPVHRTTAGLAECPDNRASNQG